MNFEDTDVCLCNLSELFRFGQPKSCFAFSNWKLFFNLICRFYEIKDEKHAEAFWSQKSLAEEDSLPLGDRVAALKDRQRSSGIPDSVKLGPGGSRSITFTTRSSSKYKEDEEDKQVQPHKRRGVQSLGLKRDRSEFHGRGRGRGRGRGGKHGRGRRGGRR